MTRDTLRFLTCGSVDDGKSTLIGRLLCDSRTVFDDEMQVLAANSARYGTVETGLDFALLLDGLQAEREQAITIDVAYRHFSTGRRAFVVADAPGHVQYTRNMATGASTADLAVVLVDVRKGVLPQTCRHVLIASLMGIRHIVLAVNKMDLAGWHRQPFDAVVERWRTLAERLGVAEAVAIPLSALSGDNVAAPSASLAWYGGPTLLDYLETVDVATSRTGGAFRFPVQMVLRPHQDFRGYAGTVADGPIRPGDEVAVLPSGRTTRVARIVGMGGDLAEAEAGRAVALTLADDVDASRGDVLCPAGDRPELADQFAGHLVWMSDQPMFPGRRYLLRLGTATVGCQVSELKHRLEPESLEHAAAKRLQLNEIGYCSLALARPIAFEPYAASRRMGGFILIDPATNATLACGMVSFGLRRAHNVHLQAVDVDKRARAAVKGQTPLVLWFTGLSGAGKSTVANLVEKRLHGLGRHTYLLDGDNLRLGLNKDLGFTQEDRVENIRRAAECAKLMVDAGLIVLVALISPFRAERAMARGRFADGEFLELFVDTPLAVCETRDSKGLYKKARAGALPNFTGIDSPYEPPEAADLVLDAAARPAEELADEVVALLRRRRAI
jgi:bifunctional enzyme CysN/CysC